MRTWSVRIISRRWGKPNTKGLRAWVLDLAGQIRAARARVGEVIVVEPKPGQCRPCGMRGQCGQARL